MDVQIVAGVVAAVVLLPVIAVVISYNRFVGQRNLIHNSWANVDTELRRRYDLIPNLVETVKGYAAHERSVFEMVTEARSRAMASVGPVAEQAAAERGLVDGVRRLFAVAENYPDLKASVHFVELQRELANTENRIQAARRFFNNNVRDYNRRVQSVPSNVVAGWFRFGEEEYFEVDEAVRIAPEVVT